MKIYIAHNFAARQELARSVVPYLKARGHEITSRWIWDHTNQMNQEWAEKDLADLDAADALLVYLDNCGNTPGRGKYVEFGYAAARGKRIYAHGLDEGLIFVLLPGVVRIASLEQIPNQ